MWLRKQSGIGLSMLTKPQKGHSITIQPQGSLYGLSLRSSQVLTLLAVLVHKYKFTSTKVPQRSLYGLSLRSSQVLTLLTLLVQKYKY